MTKIEDLPNQKYFTPKEAAYHVDVDQTTVCRWCKSGFWNGIKPRGRWSVDRESIVKYLALFAGIVLFAAVHTEFIPSHEQVHAKLYQKNLPAFIPAMMVRRRDK